MIDVADPIFSELLNIVRLDNEIAIVGGRHRVVLVQLRESQVVYSISLSSSRKMFNCYFLTGLLDSRSMGKIVTKGVGSKVDQVNIHSFQLGPYDLGSESAKSVVHSMSSDLTKAIWNGPRSLSAEVLFDFYRTNKQAGGVLRSVAIYITGVSAGYPDDIIAPHINRHANPMTSKFFDWVSADNASHEVIRAMPKF